MAAETLIGTQVLLGATDITGFTGSLVAGPAEVITKDQSNFGSGQFRRKNIGLRQGSLKLDGFADFASTGISNVFTPTALGTQYAVGWGHDGAVNVGDRAGFTRAYLSTYTPWGGQVGESAMFAMGMNPDTAMVEGYCGAPLASRTTSGFTGASVTMAGPTASQKVYAALWVPVAAGTNLAVKVQSAPASNFASPTDRITFSTVSATGWQFATPVSGAITDGFWRVLATIASVTFTFACFFGVAT